MLPTYIFENGMQLIRNDMPGFPLITLQVIVHTGVYAEKLPYETDHLLEHCVASETRPRKSGIVGQLGARSMAYTYPDMITVYELSNVASSAVVSAKAMLAHLAMPDFEEESIALERQAVRNERDGKSGPSAVFSRAHNETLWRARPNHSRQEQITVEHLKQLYFLAYRPDNMTAILSGDLSSPYAQDILESLKAFSTAADTNIGLYSAVDSGYDFSNVPSIINLNPLLNSQEDYNSVKVINKSLGGFDFDIPDLLRVSSAVASRVLLSEGSKMYSKYVGMGLYDVSCDTLASNMQGVEIAISANAKNGEVGKARDFVDECQDILLSGNYDAIISEDYLESIKSRLYYRTLRANESYNYSVQSLPKIHSRVRRRTPKYPYEIVDMVKTITIDDVRESISAVMLSKVTTVQYNMSHAEVNDA